MNINWDLVVDCLGIMGKGMLGIFLVIAVIWALVALLNKVTGKRGGESGSQESPAPGGQGHRKQKGGARRRSAFICRWAASRHSRSDHPHPRASLSWCSLLSFVGRYQTFYARRREKLREIWGRIWTGARGKIPGRL